jgi:transposase InsO family protein
MILGLVDEAVETGARQSKACEILGVDERSLQRWRSQDIGEDRRAGPKKAPDNKLTDAERASVLQIACSPRFRDLSPKQIVPLLADEGTYLASESTFYRTLRAAGRLAHRGRAKPPTHRRPDELIATGPNQVWCWDITYLPSVVRGKFFYCYTIIDLFSRKIVGRAVHDAESAMHAAVLMTVACAVEGVQRDQLTVHSDNGHPMKGATMLATLQKLGVIPSFSRPGVSDDNPYVEALFRTMKYRPEYPSQPFSSLQEGEAWVNRFVVWYNDEHRHSSIGFVTPGQRHRGDDVLILQKRAAIYKAARNRNPQRWSRACRSFKRIGSVALNPRKAHADEKAA